MRTRKHPSLHTHIEAAAQMHLRISGCNGDIASVEISTAKARRFKYREDD